MRESRACARALYVIPDALPRPSQIRQLLFAGLAGKPVAPGKPPNEPLVPLEREFKVPNPEWETWEHNGREGKAPKKQKAILLRGLVSHPIVPPAFTASGLPSVSSITLRAMVGKQGTAAELLERWDKAQSENGTEENRMIATAAIGADGEKRCGGIYRAFGGGRDGLEAAAAVDALCEASAVDTLLTNFILPLQARPLTLCVRLCSLTALRRRGATFAGLRIASTAR